ncbi:uncharacterized protein LOC128226685 [Mya arenaria]|nr:uncharacterized protein LOC128226685 [Mya arenaria]
MAAVSEKIQAKINGKKVMVFSKSYCPYCTKAKKALGKYNLSPDDYEVWEIENEPDCEAIQKELGKITGGSSVPRVFINGKFIGGGDETAAADRNGKLKTMLEG